MRRLIWLAIMALLTASLSVRADDQPRKLKGLLITGGCCHDYPNQKRIITEGVSQRANIEWDVVHEGDNTRDHRLSVYEKPDWAKGYDVIVHNECFGQVKDSDFVKAIVAAHINGGVPGVFIHCSLHSYRESEAAEAWRELLGVTSRRHEKQRPVLVKNVNPDHPVMHGFPKEWQTPNGELYVIEKVWPNCTPLAKAYGVDTQEDHTVIWTNTLGKTRVFGTSLGHHNETMNTEEWLGVVSRGLLWACGKLGDNGQPLPGYEGTGVKPIKLEPPKPEADPKFQKKNRKKTADAGFQPLFPNGDLAGWHVSDWSNVATPRKVEGTPWKYQNDVLMGLGKRTWIFSDEDYGDFVLKFDWKISEGANGGVGLRFPPTGDPAYQGMEIQIVDGERYYRGQGRPEQLTGAIYDNIAPKRARINPPGEWNRYEITCRGDRVTVMLNDEPVIDADLSQHTATAPGSAAEVKPLAQRPRSGRIGFQNLNGSIAIRQPMIQTFR